MPNGVAAAIHLAQAPPVQVSNPRYMQDSMFSVTPPHASHRLVAAPILGHTQRTISGKRKEGPWRRRRPHASPGAECLKGDFFWKLLATGVLTHEADPVDAGGSVYTERGKHPRF
jgi:hypothetical protein